MNNGVNKLNRIIDEKIILMKKKSDEFKLGYKTFGPFLFGFCKWLENDLIENDIKNIYFFARDGYIIKKAFEKICNNKFKTHYFYLSRKSLSLPSLKRTSSTMDILDSLVLPPSFNIKNILNYLNVNISKEDLLNNYGIKINDLYYRNNYKKNKKIKKLIEDNKEKIYREINLQKDNLKKYMNQENMGNKFAIVDIGWHNSIQYLFEKTIEDDKNIKNIYGYYVGIYPNAKKVKYQSKGYLYDNNHNQDDYYKTFSFVSLFELLFLSHEGTTIRYENENGTSKPLLGQYEYDGQEELLTTIYDFQEGALQFCTDFKDDSYMKSLDKTIYSFNIMKMGIKPSKNVVKIFENLYFENFSYNKMINFNRNSIYYFFHLKDLKNDFYKSGWRIIFLKKLIPFPFPHFLLFKTLCKIFIK